MRIARIAHASGIDHALLEDGTAHLIADPFSTGGRVHPLGRRVPLDAARLLAPTQPRTVVGMAHNTGEEDRRRPPQAFLKPSRTVIGPGETVPLPPAAGHVDAEAELAVVLAAPLAGHTSATVHRAVFGYTLADDVTSRDLQAGDPLWTSAKGQAGFTPLGPWIETGLGLSEADDLVLSLGVDARSSAASTAELARGVAEVLLHLAGYLPLGPGDVVLTGAPGRPLPLAPGSRVEIAADAIGTLAHPVARPPLPHSAACGLTTEGVL
jgi:2-keto-4-pentenoate hydratase/2-oxohepta-3-ene-1,7-dioic acid hydratase in catechol pathway